VEFRVLGPLQVVRDGDEVPVNAAKQRVLLAVLALRAGQLVAVDELVDRLWGASPPAGARNTLRAYVMRLRKALGDPTVIETMLDGYRLVGGTTDVQRFDALVADGRSRADLAVLDEALALWRGDPAEGLLPTEAQTLADRRLDAVTTRCGLAIELGRHEEVIDDLSELVGRHPLREDLWVLLIRAQHRAGRTDEALASYRQVSELISDELGIDPGEELQALHRQLRGDAPTAPRRVSQLPAVAGGFVGRHAEMARLSALLVPDGPTPHPPVVTVSGPPGVGKTSLVVRVAHEIRERFPDGQLFVDLRGYSQAPPVTSADVLSRFLRDLGVSPDLIPASEQQQIELFRAELAGKRVLVVLDNAATPEQVRPLLPETATCSVLITSRDSLRGLTAAVGAHPVGIDVLPAEDSLHLLGTSLGEHLLVSQADAMAELSRLCGGLPLALRIAAGNLAGRPSGDVAEFVRALRGADRLTALRVDGDEQTAVGKAFELSYTALPPAAQRLFRLLSLVPGADFTSATAAALLDCEQPEAAWLMGHLTTANLVQPQHIGRLQCHDLIRAYAAARADSDESESSRQAAVHRLYAFYLHTARAAVTTIRPEITMMAIEGEVPRVQGFVTQESALNWLVTESPNLIAAVRQAAEDGPAEMTWLLSDALRMFFQQERRAADWEESARLGLAAATAAKALDGEAAMERSLATCFQCNAQQQRGVVHLRRALALYQQIGDARGEAACLNNLSLYHHESGNYQAYFRYASQSLAACRQADENTLAPASNVANALIGLAKLPEAEAIFRQTYREAVESNTAAIAVHCLFGLYRIELTRGRFKDALDTLQRCLELMRAHDYGVLEISTLNGIANLHLEMGDFTAAADWVQVLLDNEHSTSQSASHMTTLNTLGRLARFEGRLEEASQFHRKAVEQAANDSMRLWEAESMVELAASRRLLGHPEESVEFCATALRHLRPTKCLLGTAWYALTERALALIDLDRPYEAGRTARKALRLTTDTGQPVGRATALHVHGLAQWAAGDHAAARTDLDRAADAFAALEMTGNPTVLALAELAPSR
jgi:DNA-binding SARP family transcriptional activator